MDNLTKIILIFVIAFLLLGDSCSKINEKFANEVCNDCDYTDKDETLMECIYNQADMDDGWIHKEDIKWCEKCKKCQDKKPVKGGCEAHDPKGFKYCNRDRELHNIEHCKPDESYNGVCPVMPGKLDDLPLECEAHDPSGLRYCSIDNIYEDISDCKPADSIDKKCPRMPGDKIIYITDSNDPPI